MDPYYFTSWIRISAPGIKILPKMTRMWIMDMDQVDQYHLASSNPPQNDPHHYMKHILLSLCLYLFMCLTNCNFNPFHYLLVLECTSFRWAVIEIFKKILASSFQDYYMMWVRFPHVKLFQIKI